MSNFLIFFTFRGASFCFSILLRLFMRFDRKLKCRGQITMSGQGFLLNKSLPVGSLSFLFDPVHFLFSFQFAFSFLQMRFPTR